MIHELGQNQYVVSGEISVLDKNTVEITELPIRTWTQVWLTAQSQCIQETKWNKDKDESSIVAALTVVMEIIQIRFECLQGQNFVYKYFVNK